MSLRFAIFLLLISVIASHLAEGNQADVGLFSGLWENANESVLGDNFKFHMGAIVSTHVLIKSGADAYVYDRFRHSKNELAWGGAVAASGLGALGLGLFLITEPHLEERVAAYGVFQATAITATYVKTLKLLSGRSHPTNSSGTNPQQQSESFDFFSFDFKTGYGWPSGHMSHTVAVFSVLSNFYPQRIWLKTLGAAASVYMLYSISAFDSGQMHWFSDGIAGGLVGYAIGSTVGKNMRHRFQPDSPKAQSHFNLWPILGSSYYGAALNFNF